MDGVACFERLASIRKDVCVIMTSGFNEPEAFDSIADHGIAAFLHKPYNTAQLVEKLQAALKCELDTSF